MQPAVLPRRRALARQQRGAAPRVAMSWPAMAVPEPKLAFRPGPAQRQGHSAQAGPSPTRTRATLRLPSSYEYAIGSASETSNTVTPHAQATKSSLAQTYNQL